jgi:hypothetical protein
MQLGYHDDVLGARGWTVAHEYAHTFALPDEYIYTHLGYTAATVTYKRANGPGEAVVCDAPANIMAVNGSTLLLKRHVYFAAIEAQELFRKKSGRAVVCEVVGDD